MSFAGAIRRGSRIQKGGFRTFRRGGVLGKSTSNKKLQTAVGGGGGPITPQKTLYPRMAIHVMIKRVHVFLFFVAKIIKSWKQHVK